MRIQILGINYAPEHTGIAPYTTGLARHLARHHDVTVITGLPHYPDWKVPAAFRRWRHEQVEDGVRVVRLAHYVPRDPQLLRRAAFEASWAARAIQAGRAEPAELVIAVVPALFAPYAAHAIAARHRCPVAVVVQDVMGSAAAQSGVAGGRRASRLVTAIERRGLARAASVATIHPRLAEELDALLGAARPAHVIYNWTHLALRPPESLRSLRAELNWPDDAVVALHSGNMGAKQNLEVVVDAARMAERERLPVHFVLAGGGSRRGRLEALGRGCANLQFVPSVADDCYLDLLSSADVLLVNERPGMREMSMPSKLTSYLVSGRPIVAATDPDSTTAEFIRACGGGLLSRSGDPAMLLEKVQQVADDTALAASLVEAGHRFAAEHLTPAAALAAYDDWLSCVAGRRV